ncbi:thioredoxin-like protein [Seal parapoxvirus]|uniref:Thioredoxin-like protein n=1 Tax=Seal parapoxvirus TaxID=187984 RepID=A0A1Z4CGD6_9POXV|nr:thioredoxin-like protein [Seal parapoxvirus]ASF89972.1 thioredoxin-like protein [Seal parapoxvirus]
MEKSGAPPPWFAKYAVSLDPPRRCTNCSLHLTRFVNEDRDNARMLVMAQPARAKILGEFLVFCRNRELDTKVLDRELLRVLQ